MLRSSLTRRPSGWWSLSGGCRWNGTATAYEWNRCWKDRYRQVFIPFSVANISLFADIGKKNHPILHKILTLGHPQTSLHGTLLITFFLQLVTIIYGIQRQWDNNVGSIWSAFLIAKFLSSAQFGCTIRSFLSEYENLTLVKLASNAGISIGTIGFCMYFEAF